MTLQKISTLEALQKTDRVTLTHTEAAALLGIDARTVMDAVDAGEIQGVRLGRKVLLPKYAFMETFKLPSATS
jgi:excisionase family DNA binding protein